MARPAPVLRSAIAVLGVAALVATPRWLGYPFSERGERLYRSGDIVRYLPTGDVEWLRREDDQVKIRGFRVELGEVETAVTNHPSVREAVVIARVESREEKRLVAYVVSEDGVELEPEELRQTLRAKLPDYMVPSAIVVMEALPLTPSGKINRRALPAPESIFAQDEGPRTPTEELLSGLWANVLEVSRVGINDNFFELGGHSLLATQLVSRVRETFGVELPLRELFAHPTVAGLAEQVEIRLGGGMRVAAPPRTAGLLRMSMAGDATGEAMRIADQTGRPARSRASRQSCPPASNSRQTEGRSA